MEGYAKLATLMGAYPEVTIVRRFAALNTQKILYMQAELVQLESRLRAVEKEDDTATTDQEKEDEDRTILSKDWVQLKRYAEIKNASDNLSRPRSKRWRLVCEINEKLEKYNEAVIQQNTMAQIQHPPIRDVNFLKEWMEVDSGHVYLVGRDRLVWEDPDHRDLLVMKARRNESLLSTFFSEVLVDKIHRLIFYPLKERLFKNRSRTDLESTKSNTKLDTKLDTIAEETNTTYYRQSTLRRISRIVSMTMASLLPIASIVILYFVKTMWQRLVVVAGFTFAFSLVLGLVTNAALVEVFAASAAFAAVQVVFVGSADNDGSTNLVLSGIGIPSNTTLTCGKC